VKYGLLVALLAVNYALKKAPDNSEKQLVSGSDQEFVEEKQKTLTIFSSDNQIVSSIVPE